MTEHLTVANPSLQERIDATPTGMMHWSGTGPAGKTCFGCLNFDQRKLRTKAEREAPETVNGACHRWRRHFEGAGEPKRRRIFDARTPACSHFRQPPAPEET